jgi:hypothetical protein
MAAHVTTASVHDFKLFSYFFALFLIFLDIDACDFKSFGFYVSHFIHAFCLFTSIYNVLLNYASATAILNCFYILFCFEIP